MELPVALLVDLDDTILSFSSSPRDFWREALERHWGETNPIPMEQARAAIERASADYWSDSVRAARGRLDLFGSRRDVARAALAPLGAEEARIRRVADDYAVEKERAMAPLPGARAALEEAKRAGHRLGLVTNGAGADQRRKLRRFDLEELFECVVIEGEWGVGKPHPSVFEEALRRLGVVASDAVMIGDNFAADIEGAAAVGLRTVWIDHAHRGPPPGARARPSLVVAHLAELIAVGQSGTRGA